MGRRAPVLVAYGVAAALVVVGGVLAATAHQRAEFGWFAYSPLPDQFTVDAPMFGWSRFGPALLVVSGLLVAATTTGWLLGHRSGSSERAAPPPTRG